MNKFVVDGEDGIGDCDRAGDAARREPRKGFGVNLALQATRCTASERRRYSTTASGTLALQFGEARRQSVVATWQCRKGEGPKREGGCKTNPISIKPAWKSVGNEAKNEANCRIRERRLPAEHDMLASRRTQFGGQNGCRDGVFGAKRRCGAIPKPFGFAQGKLSASRPTIRNENGIEAATRERGPNEVWCGATALRRGWRERR
jgi:hypothetical protein